LARTICAELADAGQLDAEELVRKREGARTKSSKVQLFKIPSVFNSSASSNLNAKVHASISKNANVIIKKLSSEIPLHSSQIKKQLTNAASLLYGNAAFSAELSRLQQFDSFCRPSSAFWAALIQAHMKNNKHANYVVTNYFSQATDSSFPTSRDLLAVVENVADIRKVFHAKFHDSDAKALPCVFPIDDSRLDYLAVRVPDW